MHIFGDIAPIIASTLNLAAALTRIASDLASRRKVANTNPNKEAVRGPSSSEKLTRVRFPSARR